MGQAEDKPHDAVAKKERLGPIFEKPNAPIAPSTLLARTSAQPKVFIPRGMKNPAACREQP